MEEQVITWGFSIFSLIISLILVILYFFNLKETKNLRRVQTEPKVVVYLKNSVNNNIFKIIVVHNIGMGPALNIKFEIGKDLPVVFNKKLSDYSFIKNGLKFLASNQKYEFLFTHEGLIRNCEEYFNYVLPISTSYTNLQGKSREEIFLIDFNNEEQISEDINSELGQIKNAIDECSGGLREIKNSIRDLVDKNLHLEDIAINLANIDDSLNNLR